MKILDLKILSDNGQLQKHIEFNEKGLSVIYGNILEEGNSKQTNNSLGKTTLLKMIDYIFGANSDKTIIKTTLKNYELIAKVKFENRTYEVRRIINIEGKQGDFSDKIYIGDSEYKLDDYKDFFKLERKFISPQVLLSQKTNPIFCYNKTPTQQDYSIFLEMTNMNSFAGAVDKLYKEQKKLSEEKNVILKNEPGINLKKRREALELNKQTREQQLEIANEKYEETREKLKNLKTSEVSEEMIKEREDSIEKFKNYLQK